MGFIDVSVRVNYFDDPKLPDPRGTEGERRRVKMSSFVLHKGQHWRSKETSFWKSPKGGVMEESDDDSRVK